MTPQQKLDLIRQAYEAGKDKRQNGANTTNCHFVHFATPEQTKAWELGVAGKKLNIKIIEVS